MPIPARHRGVAISTTVLVLSSTLLAGPVLANEAGASSPPPSDPYRPGYHYTPDENFMNDPNGLIYKDGTYHLFYQHNPYGSTAGNGSWGHATSPDLVTWTEQPLAISTDAAEDVWSGSVVFDETNTSGLGRLEDPPLVAVYTSFDKATGVQSQALASSTDDGLTWTKYEGNPVLDIGSRDFRDPKVSWDADRSRWTMVVALSVERKVAIYSSADLATWRHESDFGPAGVSAGVWECPDLFPLTDSVTGEQHWVMVVSVSGRTQYFVGEFDGSTFTSSDPAYTAPDGDVLADFEGADYGAWTATGTAFGAGPVVPGSEMTGYHGEQLVDSFGGSDTATGTLTSPEFAVDRHYLNFAFGGGNHPRVEGGTTEPPTGTVLADFEADGPPAGWTGTGDFVGIGSTTWSDLPGRVGRGVLDTCWGSCDPATGTITSPTFTIDSDWINFLIAGGSHPIDGEGPTAVNLVVDGERVLTATGSSSPNLDWVAWDVSVWAGQSAVIEVVDQRTSDWGHLMLDHIVFSDAAAKPWSAETTANLLVDGDVVRSATGRDGAGLDWVSWDLTDLQGATVQIQLVDAAVGGWGHLLADQFVLADRPALSVWERARFLDHGSDFYAAVTWNDVPDDRRILIGWMGNWDYANSTPTGVWRGEQSLPRELTLTTRNGRLDVLSSPVQEADSLVLDPVTVWSKGRIRTHDSGNGNGGHGNGNGSAARKSVPVGPGTTPVDVEGTSLRIDAVILPGTASTFGVDVRVGGDQLTRIGYDVERQEIFIDRKQSGDVSLGGNFAAVHRATLPLDGPLNLEIWVDSSSVEVFAEGGRVAITDLVFPDLTSDGVRVFAAGGTAQVSYLAAHPVETGARPS